MSGPEADAPRAVIVVSSQTNAHPQVNVVLNWFDELLQRVPVQ